MRMARLTSLNLQKAAVVVDSLTDPSAIYANVAVNESGITITAAEVEEQALKGIVLGSEGTTLTAEALELTVTTTVNESESETYTINSAIFVASGTALTIATAGMAETTTLSEGTVVIGDEAGINSVQATNEEAAVEVTDDNDGVIVIVSSDGTVSSITMLSEDGVVTFGNTVYSRVGDQVAMAVTDDEGNVTTTIYDYTEEDNLLELDPDSAITFVPGVTDTIDLSIGEEANHVIYGSGDTYSTETIVADLTKGEDGVYALTGTEATPNDVTIVASDMAVADITVTTDFAATFIAPTVAEDAEELPKFTINGSEFVPQAGSGLTIDVVTEDNASTLNTGVVMLDSTGDAAPQSVSLTNGAEVTAKGTVVYANAENGDLIAVSDIDALDGNEVFTISGTDTADGEYTKTAAGLFVTLAGDVEGDANKIVTGGIDTDEDGKDTLTIASIETSDYLTTTEGALDLTVEKATGETAASEAGIGVYSSDLSAKLATVNYTADSNTFDIVGEETEETINTISISAESTIVNVDFATTINTAEGTGTYTINEDSYVAANDSALSIVVSAGEEEGAELTTALDSGSVALDNTSVALTSGVNVEATSGDIVVVVEAGGELTAANGIGNGESFTVDDVVYEMTNLGLFRTTPAGEGEETDEVKLLADSVSEEDINYVFAEGTWTAVEVLDEETAIVINAEEPAESTTYVNVAKDTVIATYADGTLTSGEAAVTNPITLGTDGIVFTGNFSGAEITLNEETAFTVTDEEANFTVSSAEGALTAEGATAITLSLGSIVVSPDQTISTTVAENAIKVDAEIESYTVTLNDDNTVNIGGIATEATISLVTTVDGSQVERATLSGKQVTYTFTGSGEDTFEQKFTVSLDEDGIDFIVDGEGKVTEITGLSRQSQLIVSGVDTTLTVNGQEFGEGTENGGDLVNGATIIGTGSGTDDNDAALAYEGGGIYVVVNSAEDISINSVDTDTNIVGDNISEGTLGKIDVDGNELIISLELTISPSAETPVTILNNTDNLTVTLQSNNDEGDARNYFHVLEKGFTVQVNSLTNLKIVEAIETEDGTVISDGVSVIPTAGSIDIPVEMELQVLTDGLKINSNALNATEDNAYGNIAFTENRVELYGDGMEATDAAAGVDFGLTSADSNFTINGKTYYTASNVDAVIRATEESSALYSGTVEVGENENTMSVDLINDETVAVVGESVVLLTAVDGTISAISGITVDESFTIGDVLYEEAGLGLFRTVTEGEGEEATSKLSIRDESVVGEDGDYTFNVAETTDENWTKAIATDTATIAIDLTGVEEDVVYVNDDRDAYIMRQTYTAAEEGTPATYDIATDTGLAEEANVTVALDAATVLNINTNATVNVAASSDTTTVNSVAYSSTGGALEIAATVEDENASSTLTNGTVNVNADGLTTTDGLTIELDGEDEDGVQVTVTDGVAQNIFGLTEGATVIYNGKTYEHIGGQIVVSDIEAETTEAIYDNITDTTGETTDLLNMTETAVAYVQIVDAAIAIAEDTVLPIYYGEEPTYSSDTYFAKLTATEATEETPATYTFAKRDGAEDIDGLTIDASGFGDGIVINAVFAAEITTAGTVTINEDLYTANESALVIATTASSTSLTAGTVDITETLNITGGQTVSVTGEDIDGVTVAVENADGESTVTSITGMNEGETVNYNNVEYAMHANGRLIVTTTNEDETTDVRIYDGQDDATNILDLPAEYLIYVDMGEDSTAIVINELEDGVVGVIYGQGAVYSDDTSFAELTAEDGEDGVAYTLTHEGFNLELEDVTIAVGGEWSADSLNITTDFGATITFNGSATVNGVAFTAAEVESDENILTIVSTPDEENAATLTNGTVIVTNEQILNTTETEAEDSGKSVEVTESTDGVQVVVASGEVTSITLVDDGETVVFDEVQYRRLGDQIITNPVDDSSVQQIYDVNEDESINVDLLQLVDPISYVVITDTITLEETEATSILYGTPTEYSPSTYYARLNITEDGYEFVKNTANPDETIEGLTVDATALESADTFTTDFEANIVTAGSATVNGVAFTVANEGALTITATAEESATLYTGTVTVEEALATTETDTEGSGKTVEVSGDEANGVQVAVENGVVTSITLVDDGETVTFDEKTYRRSGDQIIVSGEDIGVQIYTVNEAESINVDLLDLTGASLYYQIDGTINITDNLFTIDEETTAAAVFFGTEEEYASNTYLAEITVNEGVYTLTRNENLEGDIPEITISTADLTDEEISVVTDFNADVASAGSVTVNGVAFVSEDELTIASRPEDEIKATLTNGTVTVSDTLTATAVEGDEETGKTVTISGEGDVVVTAEAGVINSITGLEDAETVEFDETTYKREGDRIIVTTEGEDGQQIYDVEGDVDILELENPIAYVVITDTIELGAEPTDAYYGTEDEFSSATYLARLSTEDGYAFTKNEKE